MDFSDDSYTDDDQSMYDNDESMEPMGSPSFEDKTKEIKELKTYKVLTKDDIQKIQERDVTLLSTALTVPRAAAAILLEKFKWNVQDAQEAWFNDEDGVRKSVGLLKKLVVVFREAGDSVLVCGICFENFVFDKDFQSTVGFCGHKFCGACLKTYVSVAISNGPGCLFLRCPDPACDAVIGEDKVNLLVCDEDKRKYKEFLFRSYVDLNNNNNKIKWCPTADCECAIECELGSESYAVTCNCLGSICWQCVEDSHRPVDCVMVGEWILKNNSESENVSWILAFTKPCPKCRVPIEKRSGCMHMTCKPPCNYQFCWICLGSWSRHGSCNGYANRGGSQVDRNKKKAKEYIMKYVHYYERWAANHKSRDKALADLRDIKSEKLEQLEQKHCQTAGQLEFITEAWEQIVECRRVLKWSYVYGYYMPQEALKKKQLFEFLQGEAEVALERLHNYAENKLKHYIDGDATTDEFNTEFRKELTNLTRVTGKYFANFLKRIEYSLSEAECGVWQCQECTYLNEGEHATCVVCHKTQGSLPNSESVVWECQHCTFLNEGGNDLCSMCFNAG